MFKTIEGKQYIALPYSHDDGDFIKDNTVHLAMDASEMSANGWIHVDEVSDKEDDAVREYINSNPTRISTSVLNPNEALNYIQTAAHLLRDAGHLGTASGLDDLERALKV